MIRCGIYLRISKEEEATGSNSISGQRMVTGQFIHGHKDMEMAGEWCDDGYSGVTFERPGIK